MTRTAPALRPGDRVAVIAPSGPVLDGGDLDRGLEILRSWGLDVVEGAHLRHRHGHLAAADDDRLADLHAAIGDPTIRAVLAARGGFGVQRLVDGIDWDALAADPKLLVGFSDLTSLLVAAWQRLGLVGIHGTFVGRLHLQGDAALTRLRALLTGAVAEPLRFESDDVLVGGAAEGPLVGGNLAMLSTDLATSTAIRPAGAVLFLEDVNEPPYAIDRMLTQLRRAGVLDEVAGVAVGTWRACDPPGDRPSATVEDVVADRLGDLDVPVVTGLPIGHVDGQLPVPVGARVRLDTAAGSLVFLEPAATAGATPEAAP